MKKFTIILICLVYGLSSTGAIVHLDYCCGKLSNISLSAVHDEKAKENCHGKSIHGRSCCDSKQLQLKVNGEQELIVKWVNVHTEALIIPGTSYQLHALVNGSRPVNENSGDPPDLAPAVPLFIQHSLFRI